MTAMVHQGNKFEKRESPNTKQPQTIPKPTELMCNRRPRLKFQFADRPFYCSLKGHGCKFKVSLAFGTATWELIAGVGLSCSVAPGSTLRGYSMNMSMKTFASVMRSRLCLQQKVGLLSAQQPRRHHCVSLPSFRVSSLGRLKGSGA